MVRSMARAHSAATEPVARLWDWYDGAIFLSAVSAGYFASNPAVALSISTDGFEAWRQRGYQGWPVIATVLNIEPYERVRVVSHLLLCVTAGPRQPADLSHSGIPLSSSLIHSPVAIAESRRQSARPLKLSTIMRFSLSPTCRVATSSSAPQDITVPLQTVFANLQALYYRRRYSYPAKNLFTDARLCSVKGDGTPRRSAASIAASAAALEAAKQAGKSQTTIQELASRTGIKGYSLFCAHSIADSQRYQNLSYLWSLGPSALPYDPMYLILSNVVPLLWKVFSGEIDNSANTSDPYIMSKSTSAIIGKEISAGTSTVPLSQARSLRSIQVHFGSYKAVDWLVFLLSAGEAVLADLLPKNVFPCLRCCPKPDDSCSSPPRSRRKFSVTLTSAFECSAQSSTEECTRGEKSGLGCVGQLWWLCWMSSHVFVPAVLPGDFGNFQRRGTLGAWPVSSALNDIHTLH